MRKRLTLNKVTIRQLVLIVALCAAACGVETSTTIQGVCTVDDPDCGDSGGGGSPDTLPQTTLDYSTTYIQTQFPGQQPIAATTVDCHPVAGAANTHICWVTFDFGSYWVNINCVQYSDGHQVCNGTTCVPIAGGSACTF